MAEAFDTADFTKTVAELHAAMDAGKNVNEVLDRAMGLLDKCGRLFETMQDSQKDLAKSVRRMEGELNYQGDKQDAVLQALKALLTASMQQIDETRGRSGNVATRAMGKSCRWLQAVPGTRPEPEPDPASTAADEDPAQMVKKGMLLQTVRRLFGPKGGKEVAYNKAVAAKMLEQGTITKAEHTAWKRFHRLPDHVKAS